jgi:hypothetical protein
LAEFTSEIKGDALEDNYILISDNVLSYPEEKWIENRRLLDKATSNSLARHAIMVYYIHISERWQIRRLVVSDAITNGSIYGVQR